MDDRGGADGMWGLFVFLGCVCQDLVDLQSCGLYE